MRDKLLHSLYTGASGDYDLVNSLMTLRLDTVWRGYCAKECADGKTVLDLCCGTGGLISLISKRLPKGGTVVGIDFNQSMLRKAKNEMFSGKKGAQTVDLQGSSKISGLIIADASCLPLRDGCIDVVGISFAIRNLVYQNPKTREYLKEILRILSPGGKFVCLETGQPSNLLFRTALHLYFEKIVPLMGWLISKQKDIYVFLGKSGADFPPAKEIASLLVSEGFKSVSFRPLSRGAATLYVAQK